MIDTTEVPDKIIRAAFKTARMSDCRDFRHGAVIFKRNRIIASAFNQIKTHPEGCGIHSTHHAEFAAIKKAQRTTKSLQGLSIYVIRINRHGQIRYSEPCPDCMAMIESYGLIPCWSEHDDELVEQCLLQTISISKSCTTGSKGRFRSPQMPTWDRTTKWGVPTFSIR